MESRARLLGHPIHPMLIVFPLGLLMIAVIFDIVYMVTNNPVFATVAFWNIAAGIIGGLVAAVFGVIDWLAIPNATRAKAIGLWHGVANVGVVLLFALSWLLQRGDALYTPSAIAFGLAVVAVMIALVAGWLGGELVDRLGVGVDDGAHLNAPSSLSRRPAREGETRTRG